MKLFTINGLKSELNDLYKKEETIHIKDLIFVLNKDINKNFCDQAISHHDLVENYEPIKAILKWNSKLRNLKR